MDLEEKNIAVENFLKGLNTSIAELIILSILSHSTQPMYGYHIAKVIEKENHAVPVIKLGTLYPFLRSLEKSGFLESNINPSVSGPPRRYYQITESGRQTLNRWQQMWTAMRQFVDDNLKEDSHDQKH